MYIYIYIYIYITDTYSITCTLLVTLTTVNNFFYRKLLNFVEVSNGSNVYFSLFK